MKKNKIFIAMFYLLMTLVTYGDNEDEILIRQGKNLRAWLSDSELNRIYGYLSGAQIDLEKMTDNPYFYKKDTHGDFFLEIVGNFKELEINDRGFMKDRFTIGESTYDVKYRPNYNEVVFIYNDEKVYVSNRLETAYLNIESIDESKEELNGYFDKDEKDFNARQIIYRDKNTIYGVSYLEALEKKDGIDKKKLYFNDFSIDHLRPEKSEVKSTKLLLDYPEMATALTETLPDISLSYKRLEGLLDGRIKGALIHEDALVIRSKSQEPSMEIEDVMNLYNEGVFERIGIKSSSEEGIDFFEIPFFGNKKYIFVQNEWTFISEDLDYIKNIETKEDREKILEELNTLLNFKEESIGYTRYKEGV